MKTLARILAVAMVASLLMAGSVMADTNISPDSFDGISSNLLNTLDRLYGIGNLTRIPDADDALWTSSLIGSDNALVSVTAQAKYAANAQSLYYQTEGGTPVNLFTVPENSNFDNSIDGMQNYSFTASLPNLTGTPQFFWLDDNSLSTDEWTSRPGLNYDNQDHMVTFRITGNTDHLGNDVGNFVIAWEDLPYGTDYTGISDRDYNDLIVEVNATPEPATMALLGIGLIGLAAAKRKFRK